MPFTLNIVEVENLASSSYSSSSSEGVGGVSVASVFPSNSTFEEDEDSSIAALTDDDDEVEWVQLLQLPEARAQFLQELDNRRGRDSLLLSPGYLSMKHAMKVKVIQKDSCCQ